MKNYVKPSLEINKFAVEDIICASGVVGGAAAFTIEGTSEIYDKYLETNTGATYAVEFEW